MNVPGITSPDMSATINGAVKAGWVYIGTGKNHTVGRIQWPATGEVVNFSTTPRSGGWKTTAEMIYKASGVDLRRKGSNRRSRKNFSNLRDPQVEASRRRHREQWRSKEAERENVRIAEEQRRAGAKKAAADDRRRREIEDLMR